MDTYMDSLYLNDDSIESFMMEYGSKYNIDISYQVKNLQFNNVTINEFYEFDEPTQKLYLKYLLFTSKYSHLYKILGTFSDIFFEDKILFYSILYKSTLTINRDIIYNLIKLFIDKGFDVTSNNNLAIKIAPRSSFEILKLIVGNGGDVTIDNNFPIRNFLGYDSKIFFFLIENGADPYINDCFVLKNSIGKNLDIVKYYFESGVDINIDKGFCLRKSIFDGNLKTVEYLLKYGADVNLLNDFDIFLVIQSKNMDILNLLVESGVDLSRINSFCESKINKSVCDKKYRDTFYFLINQGVNPFNIVYIMD
ncbi:ankyrin repeat protein [Saudi moumouvirus]|nr:ankyrin repeat protein [Saudi moumouvirus]